MIDIENVVFDNVKTAILLEFPEAFIESTYVERPPSFPCVSLVESDSTSNTKTIEISGEIKHENLTYECNVYTNGNGKKMKAKQIADIVDTAMSVKGFRRTMRSQIPNVERTIYRITMRFVGTVAQGIEDGDNIIYLIYKQ